MYCPQCSTESSPGLQYCRVCGANLKVIGKAVALSEAIARSDRGPLPKLKEMMKNLKVEQVTDEVSQALDHMNEELMQVSSQPKPGSVFGWNFSTKKTPAERRERRLTNGIVSLFSGAAVTIFLYHLSQALVLKLPPHIIEQIPFEVDPVVRVIWLVGLIPALSGVGNILAGLLVRPAPEPIAEPTALPSNQPISAPTTATQGNLHSPNTPGSVTERTTNLLDRAS